MSSNRYENLAKEILSFAGVEINGSNPWDIQVHNKDFYKRAITEAELGIGESYMDALWDCEKLDEMIYRIIKVRLDEKVKRKPSILFRLMIAKLFNLQTKKRAFIIGERHYDLGNDLFLNMLDKRMNYSCAYWKNAESLDEAQENKLELICKKLYLKPGMRVLDIGCGWSAFGKYAAEKYNVETVGITVSKEQVEEVLRQRHLPTDHIWTPYTYLDFQYLVVSPGCGRGADFLSFTVTAGTTW